MYSNTHKLFSVVSKQLIVRSTRYFGVLQLTIKEIEISINLSVPLSFRQFMVPNGDDSLD